MSGRKQQRRLKRRASKLPGWMLDIAASKSSASKVQHQRARRLGTFGAASEVRHIDPKAAE